MMIQKFSFILFSLICLGSFAQDGDRQLLDTANAYYKANQFSNAAEGYLMLIDKGYNSDDIHYNLANAYFKRKQIAKAILHYEKALKINPSHEDAAYNLKLANEKTVDKIEAIPDLFIYRWWKAIYNFNTADGWAKWVVGLFFATLLLFSLYLFIGDLTLKKMSFYASLNTLLLAFICWFLAAQQKSYTQSKAHAIIMTPTIDIISAPSEGSSQLFVLHEGTKVKIKDESNDWLKVALPNGNEGWVKKEGLEAF